MRFRQVLISAALVSLLGGTPDAGAKTLNAAVAAANQDKPPKKPEKKPSGEPELRRRKPPAKPKPAKPDRQLRYGRP